MKNEIRNFLEEAIKMELNMSELYQLFYARFPEDAQFWWDLSLEEINHAALIRTINDLFIPERLATVENLEERTQKMREENEIVRSRLQEFDRDSPLRSEAFMYAFDLENSFGEIHFDLFMNELPGSEMETIFQKLNGEDKNHALRINEYMKSRKIL